MGGGGVVETRTAPLEIEFSANQLRSSGCGILYFPLAYLLTDETNKLGFFFFKLIYLLI